MTMTATQELELVLFDGDNSHCYFDVDQCKDIAHFGMALGVPGFIYNHNLHEWFNENYEEIECYLNTWCESLGEHDSYIQWLSSRKDIDTHLELKQAAVWAYVELKCYDFLCENDIDF